MKIGIDARMYGESNTTGIGMYIKKLIEYLAKIDKKNQYVIFLRPEQFSSFTIPAQNFSKVAVKAKWYTLAEQLQVPLVLTKHKLDLVHFPNFNVPLLYFGKFVVTIHDLTPKAFPGPLVKKSWIRKLAYGLIFNKAINYSKNIITVSDHVKKQIIENFKVAEEKIKVIHLGYEPHHQPYNDQVKNKFNITKPYLLYVGVWRDHKNLPTLIKAFDLFRSKFNQDYQLVLAGQQDSRYPEIFEQISESKYKSDIITPGFVENHDLPSLYHFAKIFVLPSYSEGFGLVALEALNYGTPVVASQTTSLPEVLQQGAIYFDPNNPEELAEKINNTVADEKLFNQVLKNGQSQIRRYSWNETFSKTLNIYEKV